MYFFFNFRVGNYRMVRLHPRWEIRQTLTDYTTSFSLCAGVLRTYSDANREHEFYEFELKFK